MWGSGLEAVVKESQYRIKIKVFYQYRQWLQLLLSLLVLHADGAADEDDDEDHNGRGYGGEDDGDDVITFKVFNNRKLNITKVVQLPMISTGQFSTHWLGTSMVLPSRSVRLS